MFPLDPVQPAAQSPKSSMAPPYVNEDPNIEAVEQGLEMAEEDIRDAVVDQYEEKAIAAGASEEVLNDISYPKDNAVEGAPEISAIRKEEA